MRCALKSSIWPVLALLAGLFLPSCEAADKARMKLVGIKVCDPEPESAEWVLMEAVKAASEKDDDKGWDRLQKSCTARNAAPTRCAAGTRATGNACARK